MGNFLTKILSSKKNKVSAAKIAKERLAICISSSAAGDAELIQKIKQAVIEIIKNHYNKNDIDEEKLKIESVTEGALNYLELTVNLPESKK